MTELRKPVRRRTVEAVPSVRRKLVVAMEPGDVLAFREHGRRKWYRAPIAAIFFQVVRWNAKAETAAREGRP